MQNDFIITKKRVGDISKNSVGIIKEDKKEVLSVYFIGRNTLIEIGKANVTKIDIYKTGKGYDLKICNVCHILKPTKEFDKNQTDAKGMLTTRPSCKNCRKEIDGIKLLKEEKIKIDSAKPKKGSMFVCPICNKKSIVGVTANLVRDHNHTTGKAREWICDSCNTGLGRFKDNIKMFEKIIEYLKRFEHE